MTGRTGTTTRHSPVAAQGQPQVVPIAYPGLVEAMDEAGLTSQELLEKAQVVFNSMAGEHRQASWLLQQTLSGAFSPVNPRGESYGLPTHAAYAFAIVLQRPVDDLFAVDGPEPPVSMPSQRCASDGLSEDYLCILDGRNPDSRDPLAGAERLEQQQHVRAAMNWLGQMNLRHEKPVLEAVFGLSRSGYELSNAEIAAMRGISAGRSGECRRHGLQLLRNVKKCQVLRPYAIRAWFGID